MLDAFFAMTEKRFAAKGITNVFAPADVRNFFRDCLQALEQEKPGFFLHGLEVTEKYRAIIGSSRVGGRIICEFSAIADDEITRFSPGGFLLFDNIQEACDRDLPSMISASAMNLTNANGAISRSATWMCWCRSDSQGEWLALGLEVVSRFKARIKGNQALWAIRGRAGARGKAAPVADEFRQAADRVGCGVVGKLRPAGVTRMTFS